MYQSLLSKTRDHKCVFFKKKSFKQCVNYDISVFLGPGVKDNGRLIYVQIDYDNQQN